MTVLDSFIAFARALPAASRADVEASLAALMDTYSSQHDFTAEQSADLKRRAAERDPEYSDPQDIAQMFGKSFRG